MRVLQCLTTGDVGGAELYTLDLVEGLRRAGVDVDVCVFYPPGALTRRFATLGVEVIHLGRIRRVSPAAALRFVRLLRARRYDVLHLYGARVNLVGRLAARLGPRPRVVAALQSVFPGDRENRALVWLDRLTLPWVGAYLSNSRAAVEFLVARGFPREIFRLAPAGIRAEAFGRGVEREAVRRALGIEPRDGPVVISVANLRPMKGHDCLIAALARVRAAGLPCVALFVGDGPLRGDLEARVRAAGLEGRVVFAGARPDVADLLAASDVFALASTWEGLPRAILEAMASGLPVVATAVGGIGEVVDEGTTGFLTPAGDAPALAVRLTTLLADRGLRAAMGARGQARVRAEFSVEQMVARTVAVYHELCGSPVAGAARSGTSDAWPS